MDFEIIALPPHVAEFSEQIHYRLALASFYNSACSLYEL